MKESTSPSPYVLMVPFPHRVRDKQVPGTSSQRRGRQCSPTAQLCRTHPMALRGRVETTSKLPLKIDGTCHPGDLRHLVLSLGRHCGGKGITKGESENHPSTEALPLAPSQTLHLVSSYSSCNTHFKCAPTSPWT